MAELALETCNAVDAYWAAQFGCSTALLRPAQSWVAAHAATGARAMSFGGAPPIASVPSAHVDHAQRLAEGWTPETIRDLAALSATLGDDAGIAVGPAFIGYCDRGSMRVTSPTGDARLLSTDTSAIETLRAACSPVEWEHGGGSTEHGSAVGVYDGGVLAALATYEVWGERLAHIAIVAHPQYRGRSYARTAVAALTTHVLERGLIAQYRTLESNTPSMRLGEQVGFVPYATGVAVRVRYSRGTQPSSTAAGV